MEAPGGTRRGGSSSKPAGRAKRKQGSGGIFPIRQGVWRVDTEMPRDPVTGRRRRTTRQIEGSRRDAEVALARLKVANEERRLPSRGTTARTVRAVFDASLEAADSDQVELAPKTIVTSRSVGGEHDVVGPTTRRS